VRGVGWGAYPCCVRARSCGLAPATYGRGHSPAAAPPGRPAAGRLGQLVRFTTRPGPKDAPARDRGAGAAAVGEPFGSPPARPVTGGARMQQAPLEVRFSYHTHTCVQACLGRTESLTVFCVLGQPAIINTQKNKKLRDHADLLVGRDAANDFIIFSQSFYFAP
jgi:hypothetical protein